MSNKKTELPLVTPLFSTYHNQGTGCAIIHNNESIKNWYLNNSVQLCCNRKFIGQYSTPFISVVNTSFSENPYLIKHVIAMKPFQKNIHSVIRQMIDNGYYVFFDGIDDFYIDGKSWYQERHFLHDGLIFGYDQNDKTYNMFAYDSTWVYRAFKTPQKSFETARVKTFEQYCGNLTAIEVSPNLEDLNVTQILKNLTEYLNSDLEKYPPYFDENAYGIVVHDYIAIYLYKHILGAFTYDKIDRRIFRMLWEHKKVMLERIKAVEKLLKIEQSYSSRYEEIVKDANNLRMIYATHIAKRRDSILQNLLDGVLQIKEKEKIILTDFVENAKEKSSYGFMAVDP